MLKQVFGGWAAADIACADEEYVIEHGFPLNEEGILRGVVASLKLAAPATPENP
ncbi:hypothetical protein [Litorivivens sp.]|uniref:hypothetical protein n=1 Tax=Litorivivens sp. TaxID=2020868 RepID=UPI003569BD2B